MDRLMIFSAGRTPGTSQEDPDAAGRSDSSPSRMTGRMERVYSHRMPLVATMLDNYILWQAAEQPARESIDV